MKRIFYIIVLIMVLIVLFTLLLLIVAIVTYISIDLFFYFYAERPILFSLIEFKRALRMSIGGGIPAGIGFGILYIKENKK